MSDVNSLIDTHLAGLAEALLPYRQVATRLGRWGAELAWTLGHGGRLLIAGNGGSAAEAQHLTGELVGRFLAERRPLSAIPLHADGSSLTAIGNDFGPEEAFARQVEAHGRPGDVLVAFSTSGRSGNVLRAVERANRIGMVTWALTGRAPNPLAEACDEALACPGPSTATVQEMHLVAVHLLCGAVDRCVRRIERERSREGARREAAARRRRRRELSGGARR